MIEVTVRTDKPVCLAFRVFDATQGATVFAETEHIVNGVQSLYFRLPISPNTATLWVARADKKNATLEDSSFKVTAINKKELQITLPQTEMDTMLVKSFVGFAKKFCYKCGVLATNRYYTSTVGNFKIEYLPYITSLNEGKKMATPARISTKNGLMQVSKESFANYTVPMRMAILCHEFSHYYVNSDVSNETEADLNGLTIYLGLGFPIREGYMAFTQTFQGYPSQQNRERYKIIDKYIRDYVSEHKLLNIYANEYQNSSDC
jgi:hypothetical protein